MSGIQGGDPAYSRAEDSSHAIAEAVATIRQRQGTKVILGPGLSPTAGDGLGSLSGCQGSLEFIGDNQDPTG